MKREHEESFDIIRAVSAIAIVLYHYSYVFYEYGIKGSGPEFLRFENGDFGGIFVAVFFMLSGASLLYNHPSFSSPKDVLRFYGKRWLSIFPAFYIAWIIMYVINSLRVGGWFWGGPRKNFLLSFLGMDGYFLHLGMNYYCLGEWFLGGIILMYLFYPLLLFLWNRARIPSTVLITFLFLFNFRRHYFSSAPDTNIFIVLIKYYNSHIVISDNMCLWTCFMDFWLGFIIVTYFLPAVKKRIPKGSLMAAGLLILATVPFLITPLPLNKLETCTVLAFLSMLILMLLTPFILKAAPLSSLLKLISRYSYGVFLVHHVLLYGIMWLFRDFYFNRISSLLFFIPVFAVILLTGWLLTRFSRKVTGAVLTLPDILTGKKSEKPVSRRD
ncbi:MAG: acyltransferase [Lachnospiraceae bacterium]|nr:acyltransferase [Lachnospiraceae bacterium]